MNAHAYYSREDVQNELVRIAKDREVQVWFGDVRGRRPEIVNFRGDLKDMIKRGMTSFHVSEERWKDPLMLKPGMLKRDLDNLRKGWELLLDVDGKDFEFSRLAGYYLVEALKFHDVKCYSVKFSGNKGVHIGVPFEAFPVEVNNVNIKNYFPDGVRIIANYLKEMIRDHLREAILKNWDVNELVKISNLKEDELIKDGKLDPYLVVDIDSVLISSRHMFRAPYSLNEKRGLVSIMINDIMKFKLEDAKPENVIVKPLFLNSDNVIPGEAKRLLKEAFDAQTEKGVVVMDERKQVEVSRGGWKLQGVNVKEEFFPLCMKLMMKGMKEDGRKRAVFLMINFLLHMGWDLEKIKIYLDEWNTRNYEPLREGYIIAQINWFRKQKEKVLPANCDNKAYYLSIGVCKPDEMCKFIKNPVNYAIRKIRIKEGQGKKKVRKKKAGKD